MCFTKKSSSPEAFRIASAIAFLSREMQKQLRLSSCAKSRDVSLDAQGDLPLLWVISGACPERRLQA
jgi:hypothetical protein